ncbi:MAG: hypothetical protein DRJ52_05990 [Thermoprotei archaeon]|nr:MAG: hypothetical protein DRJ52_05990 [Thermoprotei archaeon]RLE98150.1 MAG: hypothetical protein DRJ63_08120 [Thermoprotei archaeon]
MLLKVSLLHRRTSYSDQLIYIIRPRARAKKYHIKYIENTLTTHGSKTLETGYCLGKYRLWLTDNSFIL